MPKAKTKANQISSWVRTHRLHLRSSHDTSRSKHGSCRLVRRVYIGWIRNWWRRTLTRIPLGSLSSWGLHIPDITSPLKRSPVSWTPISRKRGSTSPSMSMRPLGGSSPPSPTLTPAPARNGTSSSPASNQSIPRATSSDSSTVRLFRLHLVIHYRNVNIDCVERSRRGMDNLAR